MVGIASKKAQIWSLDVIFSIVVFSFTITLLALTWLHVSGNLSITYAGTSDIMSAQVKSFSYSLMSAGSPADWAGTVNTINSSTWVGITPGIGSGSGISAAKLHTLESMANYNYSAVKVAFGITYDYYVTIKGSSSGPGDLNTSFGLNPFGLNATSIFVNKISSSVSGVPVTVSVMMWTNSSQAIG